MAELNPSELGQNVWFKIRMNQTLIHALDDYASKHGITRSEAMRRAVVALTGVSPVSRKIRSDYMRRCPVHGTAYDQCITHYRECDHCECLLHEE